MAAPVALSGLGKNGVSVGTSLSPFPSAPGAPSGHRMIAGRVSAPTATQVKVDRKRPTNKKTAFMATGYLCAGIWPIKTMPEGAYSISSNESDNAGENI